MFNIVAIICFLQLTNLPTACFSNATVAFDFPTKDECLLKRNILVDEIDQDLRDRNVSMMLYCVEKIQTENTNV